MPKICDHTSVGMMVWKNEKLLLIERANFPFGFAIPAGHVDGDETYEIAAQRELKEEVGLEVKSLDLIFEGRKDTACRRENGSWHYWKIYKVATTGEIMRNQEETKQAGWYDIKQIKDLAIRTEKYINQEITENDWEKAPGLEMVMYEFFKELKII